MEHEQSLVKVLKSVPTNRTRVSQVTSLLQAMGSSRQDKVSRQSRQDKVSGELLDGVSRQGSGELLDGVTRQGQWRVVGWSYQTRSVNSYQTRSVNSYRTRSVESCQIELEDKVSEQPPDKVSGELLDRVTRQGQRGVVG